MTKIKICGLRREQDIYYANEVQPDYIGFVFAKSKRQVTKDQAKKLKKLLDYNIKAIGVFVDSPMEEMTDLAEEGIIDGIQLHGQENEEVVGKLQRITEVPIIQAFGIIDEKDMERAMKSKADRILLDYRDGGSGRTFDWEILRKHTHFPRESIFLAGGIGIDNVQDAIYRFHPYGVDVSSGVEVNGYKDKEKMKELVRRVRDVKR